MLAKRFDVAVAEPSSRTTRRSATSTRPRRSPSISGEARVQGLAPSGGRLIELRFTATVASRRTRSRTRSPPSSTARPRPSSSRSTTSGLTPPVGDRHRRPRSPRTIAGVAVRLAYNVDHPGRSPSAAAADRPRPARVTAAPHAADPGRARPDASQVRHPRPLSVWTGSTNWSRDSWSREENEDRHGRLAGARPRVFTSRTSSCSGRRATSRRAQAAFLHGSALGRRRLRAPVVLSRPRRPPRASNREGDRHGHADESGSPRR